MATFFYPPSLRRDGTPIIALVLVSAFQKDDKNFLKRHENDKELENICITEGSRSSVHLTYRKKGGRYRNIAYKYL